MKNKKTCKWKYSQYEYYDYKTSCNNEYNTSGNSVELNDGFIWCPYCGNKIEEIK